MVTKSSSHLEVVLEVKRILELEGNAVLNCAKRLRDAPVAKQLNHAIELLRNALDQGGKIIVTGVGKSGKVAKKISSTLSSTGSFSVYLHPTEGLHGDLGIATSRDAVLALSHTGNTDELVRLLPSLKNLGIPIVSICGNANSQLATLSDAWIDGAVEQEACPHNLAPTASTTLALALGDAIAITLMQLRGFDAQGFAKNHPGGALGRRLSLKISALMHRDHLLPMLPPTASMDEVVVMNTQKKLGAVLIVENQKLLGIITDGDLRRALQHRESFFTLKASDIMTKTPITAHPEMLAAHALDLMENRPSQINVLPVMDTEEKPIGIIRIHDLVRSL